MPGNSDKINLSKSADYSYVTHFLLGLSIAVFIHGFFFLTENYSNETRVNELLNKPQKFPLRIFPNSSDTGLTVVSYNIFNIPYIPYQLAQLERTCLIPINLHRAYPQADVVIIQEMFRQGCIPSQNFDDLMAEFGWKYSTSILGLSGTRSVLNGGVQIFSKWKIEIEKEVLFTKDYAWHSADVWCNKGVKYALINKNGHNFHILGTHLQSLDGDLYHTTRKAQAVSIGNFVKDLNISQDEPVILGGDLNTDLANKPNEVVQILGSMKSEMCELSSDVKYTYDYLENDIVITKDDPSWLDYIVYSSNHKKPKKCKFWSEHLTHSNHFDYCRMAMYAVPFWVDHRSIFCLKRAKTKHLSDHFPVIAVFEY